MIKLQVTRHSGDVAEITAPVGHTLMEAIRDAGIDEMLALCGGCASCSTCHVYIADEFAMLVSEISEPEEELLDSSDHRTLQSRLACQIELTEELDGMAVTIAPED